MSYYKFKLGDKVVIVKSPYHYMIGKVCTITSNLHCVNKNTNNEDYLGGEMVHILDIPSIHSGSMVAYPPECLRPYRDSWEKDPNKIEWIENLLKQNEDC